MKHTHLVLVFLTLIFLSLQGCAGMSSRPARLQNLGNGICQDTVSGRMWQIEKSKTITSPQGAEAYAAALRVGGHSDWRLPTIDELYDLNYLFDLFQNGDCTLDRKGNYWSGGNDGEEQVGAWEISDQCDPERRYTPGTRGFVRAVRP
jgi:hypothetical protein